MLNMKVRWIYCISDGLRPLQVGQTIDSKRPFGHWLTFRKHRTAINNGLLREFLKLKAEGRAPEISIIEIPEDRSLNEAEIFHISLARELNPNLCNIMPGGHWAPPDCGKLGAELSKRWREQNPGAASSFGALGAKVAQKNRESNPEYQQKQFDKLTRKLWRERDPEAFYRECGRRGGEATRKLAAENPCLFAPRRREWRDKNPELAAEVDARCARIGAEAHLKRPPELEQLRRKRVSATLRKRLAEDPEFARQYKENARRGAEKLNARRKEDPEFRARHSECIKLGIAAPGSRGIAVGRPRV